MGVSRKTLFLAIRRDIENLPLEYLLKLVSLVPLGYILVEVFQKPVVLPFVDDWILIPWLLNDVDVNYENTFSLINGHQYAFMKIFLWCYGYLFGAKLFPIVVVGIFVIYSTLIAALKLLPGHLKLNFYSLLVGTYLIFSIFSFRQMQNIFMIICIPWVLSLLIIIKFATLLRTAPLEVKSNRMLAYSAIACFVSGLGLILTIYAILIFLILPSPTKTKLIRLFVLFVAIFISFILPQLNWFTSTPTSQNISLKSAFGYFYDSPLESYKFIATLIAQPQIPWRYNLLNIAVYIGSALLIIAITLCTLQIAKKGILKFVVTNPLFLIGAMFVIVLYLTRFKSLGAIGALEPRYTTGSIVLLIGILFLVLSCINYKSHILAICLAVSLFGLLSSGSSGINYYSDRYNQQTEIRKCLELTVDNRLDKDCYDKIEALSLGVDPKKIRIYIRTFLKANGLEK